MGQPAIFLDRDGVLNVGLRNDYVRSLDQFRWLPGSREAVGKLTAAGWPVVLITNQSGINRGYYTHEDVETIHAAMRRDLEEVGGRITAIYICPHVDADACGCRKPLPGMLTNAAADLDLDLSRSIFVGDSEIDMRAGRAAGCTVFAVASGLASADDIARWSTVPDRTFPSLLEAVEWITANRAARA